MTAWIESQKMLLDGSVSESELFDETLKKIRSDEKYLAWEWTYSSFAEATAMRSRATNPNFNALVGLQLGVKDIFNSVSGTTEMGSDSWKGHQAGNDARVVAEFTYNGATVVGKTKTAEFAVHALPDTLNPWDISKTPGTSSSGSAISVALGHVPIALGTQTGGSITRPASFTGTIGFKPTLGIHPRTGVLKTCDPFDTIGFFASSISYLQMVFEITRVRGSNYPVVERELATAEARKTGVKKLRIGRVRTPFSRFEDPYISRKIDAFVDDLPADKFETFEIDLTPHLNDADAIHSNIYNKSLSYYFKEERERGEHFSPVLNEIIRIGETVSAEEYKRDLQAIPELRRTLQSALQDVDILIAPSTATTAPKRGDTELPDTSRYWTMAHLPTVSLPLFLDDERKLPFGVQVVGAQKFGEPMLFRFFKDAGLDDSAMTRLKP